MVYQVKREAMVKHLQNYLTWLENYKENWDTGTYDNETGDVVRFVEE